MSAQGRETMIRTIGPHQIFGELAALDGVARSADVIATEPLRLAVIPGAAFVELAETHAVLGLWLARHLTRQVRFLTNRVYELSNLAVGSRLQCELLRLAIEQGISGDSAIIRSPPTQSELASRISTNRETITREMSLLVQDGLVRKSGRQIEIPSLHRLGMKVRDLSAAG
jgi:CRP-like cAMP-binding protein